MYLFGGDKPWDASQFTACDDRVRGGRSRSSLTVSGPRAEFAGTLDARALGGAGFASQRTVDGAAWDLSGFVVLVLDVAAAAAGAARTYTVTLKDGAEPPPGAAPPRPGGREQSTVSWECDFAVGAAAGGAAPGRVVIPFGDFRATYRGRPMRDAEPLDLKNVRRISFMMRSFFGKQEGDFSIVFNSVSVEEKDGRLSHDSSSTFTEVSPSHAESDPNAGNDRVGPTSWLSRLLGWKM